MNKHIVQLIRERFHPLVRFCGPQTCRGGRGRGVRGPVFLGELSIWLWPAKSVHNGVLSDEQLGDIVSPHFLVRNLLLSAQTSMKRLSSHLDRIKAADGDNVSLLCYYLEDPAATVVDGMALGRILGPRMGETAQGTMNCYIFIQPFLPWRPAKVAGADCALPAQHVLPYFGVTGGEGGIRIRMTT